MASDAPSLILAHPLIELSLVKVWKHSRTTQVITEGVVSRILRLLDSNGVPRYAHICAYCLNQSTEFGDSVVHLLDLFFFLAFLGFFAYSLDPTMRRSEPFFAPSFIVVYAFSRICRSKWAPMSVPFAVLIICFSPFLPSFPPSMHLAWPGAFFVFFWLLLSLSLPVYPSLLLLCPLDLILPLSALLQWNISQMLLPTLPLLLPALLVLMFMVPFFFFLVILIFYIFTYPAGEAILVQSFRRSTDDTVPPRRRWDRYSRTSGLAARQALVRAVATYDVPYYFPAPLNLVPVLFVRLPAAVLALFGRRSTPRWLQLVEKILWRLCVAPLAFVFNGLWLWNLRAQ